MPEKYYCDPTLRVAFKLKLCDLTLSATLCALPLVPQKRLSLYCRTSHSILCLPARRWRTVNG